MPTLNIEFGALGDGHPVPPLTLTGDTATDPNLFARAVAEHAIPHLRPVLTELGHPEYADCIFNRSSKDPTYGEFMWLDLAAQKGARFCPARITEA